MVEKLQKLVVIDDEIRQCRSMKKILEKLFPQISVEIFTDPVGAMEYIEKESIYIVITDICMPGLDGLTLVQKLMESDRRRKVILLTGYAEFEYARKAVSAGAYDFLLKPMNPDKLKAVIESCLQEIHQESLSRQKYSQMHQRLDAAWPVYMENLMNRWLTGSLAKEEQEKIQQIFPDNKKGFIVLTRFYGIEQIKKTTGSQELSELKNRLGLHMREYLGLSYHSLSFFSGSLPETMITLVFPKSTGIEYPVWMKNPGRWKGFFPELEWEAENGIQMGVGVCVDDLEEERKTAYEGAAEALQYTFYFPESNICLKREIESGIKAQFSFHITQEKSLTDALKSSSERQVLECMDTILENGLAQGYPNPQELIEETERLLKYAAMSLVYPPFFSCSDGGRRTYQAFRQEVRSYLMEFSGEMKSREEGKKSGFVRGFRDYVKEHYMENISLEDVANQFMLSPSYCSRLIKEAMGSNFTQILIEERMKEAKELLRHTNMHIYEIAVRVGYSDVKYFNRVFKSSSGMTPQQFRRECAGERKK